VRILVEMGFPEEAAKKALVRGRNDLDQAMAFILEGGSEESTNDNSSVLSS